MEQEFADIELPDMSANKTETELEKSITQSVAPLLSAKAIQYYASTQSPDAREFILRKYIDQLNNKFMTTHLSSPTRVTIEREFFISSLNQLQDMFGVTGELATQGEVTVGGKLHFFERHYYIDPTSGDLRPELALRLFDSVFVKKSKEGEKNIPVDNYVTIPVTVISNHEIAERET